MVSDPNANVPAVNASFRETRAYYMAESIPLRSQIIDLVVALRARRKDRGEAARRLSEATKAAAKEYQAIMGEVAAEVNGDGKAKWSNAEARKAETERRHEARNRPLLLQVDARETELAVADDEYEGLKRELTALTINKDLLVAEMGLVAAAIKAEAATRIIEKGI